MSLHCEYLIYPRKSPQWRGRNLGQQCEQNRVVVVVGGGLDGKSNRTGAKQQEDENNPFRSYSKYLRFTVPKESAKSIFLKTSHKKKISAMGRWKRFSEDNGNSTN